MWDILNIEAMPLMQSKEYESKVMSCAIVVLDHNV